MLVYYFVPFIVNNRYLILWVSNGHNSITVQNRTHVYMNFFDHKDLGNPFLDDEKEMQVWLFLCELFCDAVSVKTT